MRRISICLAAGVFAITIQLSGKSLAQTSGAAAASQTGTHFITLGTRGGPIPDKHRAQSSNLLIVNGTYYLIDAGDGMLRRMAQAGASFRKVGKVFITHDHDDHTAALATLFGP